ncbi:MAG: esterase-like activity of phytase family protein [Bacteroidota bacterium]
MVLAAALSALLALSGTACPDTSDVHHASADSVEATLVGFARLPADTFAGGPPSGQYGDGVRGEAPRFPAQPVQGFSGVQLADSCGAFWALSDNGFGAKGNSVDYRLQLHRIAPAFETAASGPGTIRVLESVGLTDPDGHVPFPIANEGSADRPLTGWDVDPEAVARLPDGSFWIGDEFGPFLLHVGPDGVVLGPPVATPDGRGGEVRSPQHPALVASGPGPGEASRATIRASGGFESLALAPGGDRLWALLEGPVAGDPEGLLRLYTFDLDRRAFADSVRFYPLDQPDHLTGDMAVLNEREVLVIERDARQGAEAQTKRLYRVDLASADDRGVLRKELVVDLLDLRNPHRLGGFGPRFRFPYVTVEGVLALDAQTVLVLNDNNYRSTGGRGPDVVDATEVILVRPARPLRLAPGIGLRPGCAVPASGDS